MLLFEYSKIVRMKRLAICLFVFGLLLGGFPLSGQKYIADHTVAREEVLRSIPVEYINKARRELGYAPQTDLRAGMTEAIGWYRSNGWL